MHKSILRNQLVGQCFFLVKYIERWGAGTNRIIETCLKHGLPEPLFEEITGSLVVTFRKSISNEGLMKLGLNGRQIDAVKYASIRGMINNQIYTNLTKVSRNTATKELADLVRLGVFSRVGSGKRGLKYIPVLNKQSAKTVQKTVQNKPVSD
jgi:ATP-dependent DNA helicase RecG